MNDFAVLVDFRLHPGTRGPFRALIDANAHASLREEPGCRRFDVLEPVDEPDRIVLYEIYSDRAAFKAHIETSHYAQFDQASAPLCVSKAVTICALVCEGGA